MPLALFSHALLAILRQNGKSPRILCSFFPLVPLTALAVNLRANIACLASCCLFSSGMWPCSARKLRLVMDWVAPRLHKVWHVKSWSDVSVWQGREASTGFWCPMLCQERLPLLPTCVCAPACVHSSPGPQNIGFLIALLGQLFSCIVDLKSQHVNRETTVLYLLVRKDHLPLSVSCGAFAVS